MNQASQASIVDEYFLAVRVRNARMVEVDHEAVLLDEARQFVYALNPTGTLIWRCLDGHSPLGEICADLAFALEAPLELVERDTFAIIAQLIDVGMVFDGRVGEAPVSSGGRPSTAALSVHDLVDTETFGVRVGDAVVGIACNNAAISDMFKRVVAAVIVPGSVVPAQLFLDVGATSGELLSMNYLYECGSRVLATSNAGHLMRAALRYLDGSIHNDEEFTLTGRLLVHERGAVIISSSFDCLIEVGSRGLARDGWRAADQSSAVVDPDTLEVVIHDIRLELDPEGLEDIDRVFPRGRGGSQIAPGRYPLLAIVSVGYATTMDSTHSPAIRVTQLVHFLRRSSPFRIRDLERLASVSAQVNVEWLMGTEPTDFNDLLRRLAKTVMARGPVHRQPH